MLRRSVGSPDMPEIYGREDDGSVMMIPSSPPDEFVWARYILQAGSPVSAKVVRLELINVIVACWLNRSNVRCFLLVGRVVSNAPVGGEA